MTQKSRIYIFLIALLALGMASSEKAHAQMRAIIKAGLAGSTLSGDSDADFSSITRFTGGAGVIIPLRFGLRFQAEALYAVKGARAKGEVELDGVDNAVPIEATFDITYLEIPVLLVYQFQSRVVRPKLFAGPSLAWKLDARVTFRAQDGGPEFTETDDTVEDQDIGLVLGGGLDFDIGSETLTVGVQSSLGFSNARTAKPEFYNRSIGVFAGIIF